MSVISANATAIPIAFRRRAEIVTATAALVIRTSTPVAYAPPCAFTSARNINVTVNAIAVYTSTSGRGARVHSGAIPYRGKYRGTMFSNPAIAEAPANQRIEIVEAS